MKDLCLAGPPRSGETSRLSSRDPVASRVKCGPHGGKKSKTKSWTGAGAGERLMTESACGVCGGSPQNCRVTWLSHKTKIEGSVGADGIRARQEASAVDTWRDHRACVEKTWTASKAWPCDEEECYMTYLPLRGLYHNLSARGSLVLIYPAQRDSYILTLGFLGKPSIRTASHFLAP
jgi:hypothetical protein